MMIRALLDVIAKQTGFGWASQAMRPFEAWASSALSGPSMRLEVTASTPDPSTLAPLSALAVSNARIAYAELLAAGGRVVVTASSGNGGQPVGIVIPPGFDASKPAHIQTHYHGDRSNIFNPTAAHTAAILDLFARDSQRIFVLPEAMGNVKDARTTHDGPGGTKWGNATSEAKTTADALLAAGIVPAKGSTRTLSCSSAGGRAVANILKTAGGVAAEKLLLVDCLFNPACNKILNGLLAHGDSVAQITIIRGINPSERAHAIKKAFPNKTSIVEVNAEDPKGRHHAASRFYLGGARVEPPAIDTFVRQSLPDSASRRTQELLFQSAKL